VMGISRATYYRKSLKEKEQIKSDLELKDLVAKIHLEFPGYGFRRIREYLLRQDVTVNTKRIRRVMNIYSIFSSRTQRNKPRGSHSDICIRHPNLIRGSKINAPDQVGQQINFYKTFERRNLFKRCDQCSHQSGCWLVNLKKLKA
jgi:hypothetical protein